MSHYPFPDIPTPFEGSGGEGVPSELGDRLALRRYLGSLGYPTGNDVFAPIQPKLQPTPGLRIGPVRLSGPGLDSAALSVLGMLQGMPRPQGFGQNFATGLAYGLAGGRARQAQARGAANQAAVEGAAEQTKSRQQAAREFAQGLAKHRYDMERDRAKAKEPKEPGTSPYFMLTEEQVKRAKARGFDVPSDLMVPRGWAGLSPDRGDTDSPAQRRLAFNMLLDNVKQDKDVSEFITIRDQRQTGKKAADSASSAGDIVLMRALARASDPNTGVREEEFRTFQGAQGVLDRIGVRFTSEMTGKGKLSESGRKYVMQQLEDIYQNKLARHREAVAFYKSQAAALGYDPRLIVRNFEPPPDSVPESGKTEAERVREALAKAKAAADSARGGKR